MKASSAIRIPTVGCRISPKRTLTRILTMQKQSRNWESRKQKWGLPLWISTFYFLLSALVFAQTNVTPAQYLARQLKPNFAQGYHLPYLTRFGWALSISSNTAVELANNWGYALPLDMENGTLSQLNPPNMEAGFIAMVSNNPTKYGLSVVINHNFPKPIPAGFYCTNSSGLFVDNTGTNSWSGSPFTNGNSALISPEAPDDYLALCASQAIYSLRVIRSNAPIAIVLNTGEYGLDVPANGLVAWGQDPRVQAATNGMPYTNTNVWNADTVWPRYGSNRKAHQLGFYTSAVNKLLPDRKLNIFYNTAGEYMRMTYPNNPAFWNGPYWGWDSDVMNTNTDLPSYEEYYQGVTGHAWTGSYDLLTTYLNSVGFNFKLGYTNNYSWLSGGWAVGSNTNLTTNDMGQVTTLSSNALSDIPRYTGFLKCIYTGGTVGGNAGYYVWPAGTNGIYGWIFGGPGFDAAFPSNSPPHWLLQIIALSHVHALFSHFENVLTNGDLLSGPQHHALSLDQPAYEFTNTAGYVNDRVLARKLRGTNLWLVSAWAADGITNNVTVTIPTIGNLTVNAIPSASVYQVTMSGTNVQQTLLDEYASFPLPSPTNFRVVLP